MSPRAELVTNIKPPRFTAHSRAMPQAGHHSPSQSLRPQRALEARCHLWSETISRAGSSFAPVVLKLTSATYKPPRPSTACATQHAHKPSGLRRTPFSPSAAQAHGSRKCAGYDSVRPEELVRLLPRVLRPHALHNRPLAIADDHPLPDPATMRQVLSGGRGSEPDGHSAADREGVVAVLRWSAPPPCQHRFVRTLVFAHAGPACACWFEMRERGALTNSAM